MMYLLANNRCHAHFTRITQKAMVFQWTDALEASLQNHKTLLTLAPILNLADEVLAFVVLYDAPSMALGAARELAMVVIVLKLSKHYCYGAHCEIFTDYHSLKYTFSQLNLNMRKHRLLELLKDYDIPILYHLGKINMVDSLSQRTLV